MSKQPTKSQPCVTVHSRDNVQTHLRVDLLAHLQMDSRINSLAYSQMNSRVEPQVDCKADSQVDLLTRSRKSSRNKKASPLASPSVTRDILAAHGLDPKYSFGQNFLVNDAIIAKIIKLADVQSRDKIVEVGCGIGTLTLALLQTGAEVMVVEKDADMVEVLKSSVAEFCPEVSKNLTILNQDALKLTKEKVSKFSQNTPFKLVANLPYNVAAPIVITYFQQFSALQSATVMVQKEIADRMCASPGCKNYGAYTVKLAMYAREAGRFKVSSENFMPKPRVESAVVRLDRCKNIDEKTAAIACKIADISFAHRRKTLANNIKLSGADKDLSAAFTVCGIDLLQRAETLLPEVYFSVASCLLSAE